MLLEAAALLFETLLHLVAEFFFLVVEPLRLFELQALSLFLEEQLLVLEFNELLLLHLAPFGLQPHLRNVVRLLLQSNQLLSPLQLQILHYIPHIRYRRRGLAVDNRALPNFAYNVARKVQCRRGDHSSCRFTRV
jgi:hypothetical protein